MIKLQCTLLILLGLLVVAVPGTLASSDAEIRAQTSPLQSPLPTVTLVPDAAGMPPTLTITSDLDEPPDQAGAVPPGYWRIEDWMGKYSLWTDGVRYYVERK